MRELNKAKNLDFDTKNKLITDNDFKEFLETGKVDCISEKINSKYYDKFFEIEELINNKANK